MIRSFKLSPEDFEKVILYYDEHGSFKDCTLLTNNHLSQLQPLMIKTFMVETIKPCGDDHGTTVEFELEPKYFNKLDTKYNPDLMRQYLQDIAMTNPGLEFS